MEPTNRTPRKTVDDTILPRTKPAGQAMRFEDELKRKSMTLGRRAPPVTKRTQRRPEVTQDLQQDLVAPPPPPTRIQSKRSTRNKSGTSQESLPEASSKVCTMREHVNNTDQHSISVLPGTNSLSRGRQLNSASTDNPIQNQPQMSYNEDIPGVQASQTDDSTKTSTSQVASQRAVFQSLLSGATTDTNHQSEKKGKSCPPKRSKSFIDTTSQVVSRNIKNPPPLPEEIQTAHKLTKRTKSFRMQPQQASQYTLTRALSPTADEIINTTAPEIGRNNGPTEFEPPTTTSSTNIQSLENVSDSTSDGNVRTTMYSKSNKNRQNGDRWNPQSRPYGSGENHSQSGQQRVPRPPQQHHLDVNQPSYSSTERSQMDMIKESSSTEFLVSQSSSFTQDQSEANDQDSKPANMNRRNDGQDGIDISTIISNYKQFLPMSVQVCRGFSSSISLAQSFAQFDKLYFHFVKNTQVAVLHDENGQEKYSIPLSSAVSFGLLHKSEAYAVTQTVEDIINMKPLPQVMLAKESFNGGSLDNSVEKNELLFVKEISKSPMFKKGRVLKVLTTDHRVKHLSSKCTGTFSIHPEDIRMTLATMVEHLVQLPQKVYMFSADSRIRILLPEMMRDQPVILESVRDESSIICTVKDSDCTQDLQNVMDIHTDTSIQVEIQLITESEEKLLHDTTSILHHTLDLMQLEFTINKATQREHDLQCLLYKTLVPGKEKNGVLFQLDNSSLTGSQSQLSEGGFQEHPFPNQTSNENISSASSFSDFHEDINDDDNLYEDVDEACASLPIQDADKLRQSIQEKTPAPMQSKLFKKLRAAIDLKKKKEDKGLDHKLTAHPLSHQIRDNCNQSNSGAPPANRIQETYSDDSKCYESVSIPDIEPETVDHTDTQEKSKSPFPITTDSFNNQDSSTITQLQYAQLNTKINQLVTELDSLKLQVQTLTTTVETLKTNDTQCQSATNVLTTRAADPGTSESDQKERTRNREFLAGLTRAQVNQLLTNIGLSKYSSEFAAQGIDGKQLMEIGDNALFNNFKMTSKFHQTKLIRVTSGALYASSFIS